MSPVSRFAPDHIAAALAEGDPLADAVFDQLETAESAGGDLLTVVDRLADAEGGAAKAFLDACRAPLAPATAARHARGRILIRRSPWLSGVVETLGCAVALCAAPALPPVLGRAGGPGSTGAMLMLDAGTTEAFEPDTATWRRLVRVRLVLAATRRGLDPAEARESTLSLAWAVCMWSHGFRAGLERLGVPVSGERAAAHQALWRDIGQRLGLPAALLASSPAEEADLAAALEAQLPLDLDGAVRAAEALEHLGTAPPCFASFRGVAALSRHMVGADIADRLGMPAHGDWRVAWRVALRSVAVAAPSPAPAPAAVA